MLGFVFRWFVDWFYHSVFFTILSTMCPRNDPWSWVSNSSSNLFIRGHLVRSHLPFQPFLFGRPTFLLTAPLLPQPSAPVPRRSAAPARLGASKRCRRLRKRCPWGTGFSRIRSSPSNDYSSNGRPDLGIPGIPLVLDFLMNGWWRLYPHSTINLGFVFFR